MRLAEAGTITVCVHVNLKKELMGLKLLLKKSDGNMISTIKL